VDVEAPDERQRIQRVIDRMRDGGAPAPQGDAPVDAAGDADAPRARPTASTEGS